MSNESPYDKMVSEQTIETLTKAYLVLFNHLDGFLFRTLLYQGEITTYSVAMTLSTCYQVI